MHGGEAIQAARLIIASDQLLDSRAETVSVNLFVKPVKVELRRCWTFLGGRIYAGTAHAILLHGTGLTHAWA